MHTGGDHTVSLNKLIFITKKRIQLLFTTLILLVLFIGCGTLLTSFAIISNGMFTGIVCSRIIMFSFHIDMCFTNQQVPNSLLDTILVISCLGIASILIYWVSVGYTVYKQSTEGKITMQIFSILLSYNSCSRNKNQA